MGRYRKLEEQLRQLGELQGIISSMKTLSQLELHKLRVLAEPQHGMVQQLRRVAADFLAFNPVPADNKAEELWLVIGAERGFCGDFNARLSRLLLQECPECIGLPQRVLAVGRKLWLRFEEDIPGFVPLSGASVSEELPKVLTQVVSATRRQLDDQKLISLRLFYHSDEHGAVRSQRLLPLVLTDVEISSAIPPVLHVSPQQFFAEFMQQYLHLALMELFTVSLLAENQQRAQHLEGAVQRLDERLMLLGSRARRLRQEEITEEIETILLGDGGCDESKEIM